jgi:hypothetical protein
MPFRMLPNSDSSSRTALRALTRKQDNIPAADWPYVAARGAENAACLTLLEKEMGESDTADATRGLATTRAEAAMNRTRQIVSHFVQTFNNAIDRAVLKREDRAFYELGLDDGAVPVMTSTEDVITWANNIVKGEARRADAQMYDFRPVSFPSAAEVKTELTAFLALLAAQGTATTTAIAEAHDVENIRPRIGLAILDSWDDIANKYRRLPAPWPANGASSSCAAKANRSKPEWTPPRRPAIPPAAPEEAAPPHPHEPSPKTFHGASRSFPK